MSFMDGKTWKSDALLLDLKNNENFARNCAWTLGIEDALEVLAV